MRVGVFACSAWDSPQDMMQRFIRQACAELTRTHDCLWREAPSFTVAPKANQNVRESDFCIAYEVKTRAVADWNKDGDGHYAMQGWVSCVAMADAQPLRHGRAEAPQPMEAGANAEVAYKLPPAQQRPAPAPDTRSASGAETPARGAAASHDEAPPPVVPAPPGEQFPAAGDVPPLGAGPGRRWSRQKRPPVTKQDTQKRHALQPRRAAPPPTQESMAKSVLSDGDAQVQMADLGIRQAEVHFRLYILIYVGVCVYT